ncbi:MAG: MFS transporter, partial [Spirochaetota bacterium]
CSSLFTFFLFVKVPLFSRIYRENYRSLQRGKLFSFGAILRNICNLGFNLLTAFVIDRGHYRWVLAGYAIFILLSAIACFLIPSERFDSPTSMAQKKSRLPQWGFVLRDRLFLYICLAWYFLGFGNLALVPMRVEFILDRGSLSPLQLVLILQILPGLIRSVGTVFGGKLFDRLPLLWFRIGTNFIFMTATILFFQSVSWAGLIAGMITFGLAEIGAWFIWNLWVTHLAPNKESVDTYMGVHAFLNGTRGLLGPFIVYALLDSSWVGSYGIRGLSWLAVGSMFLSTLMFLSMAGNRRVNLRR